MKALPDDRYLTDGIGAVLISGYSLDIARFTFVGEVALIFWLLIGGRRMTTPAGAAAHPKASAGHVG